MNKIVKINIPKIKTGKEMGNILIKNSIKWKSKRNLSSKDTFTSMKENNKDTLLVKSGGEAFFEKVPKY